MTVHIFGGNKCVFVCVCVCVYIYIYIHTNKVYSKSIETVVIFTKTEMKKFWNINFLLNSPIVIQNTYSSEFSIGWSTTETPLLIGCETAIAFLLMISTYSNLTLVAGGTPDDGVWMCESLVAVWRLCCHLVWPRQLMSSGHYLSRGTPVYVNALIPRTVCKFFCVLVWLTEDWTNDRDEWISFIQVLLSGSYTKDVWV